MEKADELYQSFEEKLTALTGQCAHCSKVELLPTLKKVFSDRGDTTAAVVQTEYIKELGIAEGLKTAGITVHTDHIRLNCETDQVGIIDAQYGLADLGSVIQLHQNVDERIAAIMPPFSIVIIKRSTILDNLDTMIDMLSAMPEMPNFVGFITGPSRTADIECVGTVGVHGPLEILVIVVDDQ
ncbi:LUD domain-containing protein [Megasphaera paucivorans]|uniref:L-lactate dehydrogenase complex protein LldG n=1 Tax=Megasphaera paucivorans TaxID=349095 RepID=A0A1G9V785_9FIRM|nr:LUD domain-containing protein [Megasphaera paucivorans]SDM67960.1 L-lactate dehydrogenase complex protein LldG [Megasphaera paucivorans]